MDKDCMKLHYMAPNIYIAGAGTAADCDWVKFFKKIYKEFFYRSTIILLKLDV